MNKSKRYFNLRGKLEKPKFVNTFSFKTNSSMTQRTNRKSFIHGKENVLPLPVHYRTNKNHEIASHLNNEGNGEKRSVFGHLSPFRNKNVVENAESSSAAGNPFSGIQNVQGGNHAFNVTVNHHHHHHYYSK